jgi:lipoprotein
MRGIMMLGTKRIAVATASILTFACGVCAMAQPIAEAEVCNGATGRTIESVNPLTGGETWQVKLDSCKARELVDAYSDVKDAAGFTSILTSRSKNWQIGAATGIVFGWAWKNQTAVRNCTAGGKGVQFKEVNGIITECEAQ